MAGIPRAFSPTTPRRYRVWLRYMLLLCAATLVLAACADDDEALDDDVDPAAEPEEDVDDADAEDDEPDEADDDADDAEEEVSGDIEEMTLSFGHGDATDHPVHIAAEMFAERVEELTDGAVTTEIFPSNQLGSWEEMQESLEVGSLDVHIESIGSLERFTDYSAIEGVPFLYDDDEHFIDVWDSELSEEIMETVREDSGFLLLGQLYRGPRQLNTVEPIESVDDLPGLQLRVPNQQSFLDIWDALGTSPTPMSLDEVYTALEQGVIDGQENPIDQIRFSRMYEVAPNVTLTTHVYGNFHLQLWDETFQSWDPELQDAVRTAADEMSEWYIENTLNEMDENLAFLEEEGVNIIEVDLEEWRAQVEDHVETMDPQIQEWAQRAEEMR